MIAQTTLDASVDWLARYETAYAEAEHRGDRLGMAKALDGTLRTKIAITEGDERQRLVDARAKLVMRVPQASPSYGQQRAMIKALVAAPERDQEAFAADWDRADPEYRPRPTAEQAQRDRDFAISMSLVRARQRLAKCVSVNDRLGSINAMECQLTCEHALAKSDDSRRRIQQLRHELYSTAVDAGFVYGDRGIYAMAKASTADVKNAKAFDDMYSKLTEALNRAPAVVRQKIEQLRTEVIQMAQGMGCRLTNGHFVPFAS